MSEYTPITGEMRKYATVAWDPWPEARDRLFQMCDAIDSIHAQLERENADLRMKFVTVNRHAEHVERENAALKAELDRVLGEQYRDGWVELPKDADGEYIHFGDVLDQFGTPMTVFAMSDPDPDQGDCMLELITDGTSDSIWVRARKMRHHQPDTWERIIEDAVNVHGNGFNPSWTDERDALVVRCKALCERTKEAEE